MSLVTDLVKALGSGDPSLPGMLALWQDDKGQAQNAWDQETNSEAMITLCVYSDLVLAIRAARNMFKSMGMPSNCRQRLALVDRWINGEDVPEDELLEGTRSASGCPGRFDYLIYAFAYAGSSGNTVRMAGVTPDYCVRGVRENLQLINEDAAPAVRQICPFAPAITMCNECFRPATYLRERFAPFMTRNDERKQAHWLEKEEHACYATRRCAERVKGGLSPISARFGDRRIIGGQSPLAWLEEAAQDSGASDFVIKSWESAQRVLSIYKEPWNVNFLKRDR